MTRKQKWIYTAAMFPAFTIDETKKILYMKILQPWSKQIKNRQNYCI